MLRDEVDRLVQDWTVTFFFPLYFLGLNVAASHCIERESLHTLSLGTVIPRLQLALEIDVLSAWRNKVLHNSTYLSLCHVLAKHRLIGVV